MQPTARARAAAAEIQRAPPKRMAERAASAAAAVAQAEVSRLRTAVPVATAAAVEEWDPARVSAAPVALVWAAREQFRRPAQATVAAGPAWAGPFLCEPEAPSPCRQICSSRPTAHPAVLPAPAPQRAQAAAVTYSDNSSFPAPTP